MPKPQEYFGSGRLTALREPLRGRRTGEHMALLLLLGGLMKIEVRSAQRLVQRPVAFTGHWWAAAYGLLIGSNGYKPHIVRC